MTAKKYKTKRLVITLLVSISLLFGTVLAVLFAKGYRPTPKKGITTFEGTGLLSATSTPKSAEVYIDGNLVTATDDTVNLEPGHYDVTISKEGFHSWQKNLEIKKELVTTTNARLFPSVPSLSAITYTGVNTPTPSPDGKHLAFIIDSFEDQEKNGLYVIDLTESILNLNRAPQQLFKNSSKYNSDFLHFAWSPDSKQLMLIFQNPKNAVITGSFLVSADTLNNLTQIPDSTIRLSLIYSEWEEDLVRSETNLLRELPDFMVELITTSAKNVYFSPDGEKMLYTATQKLTIPNNLIDPLASINSTPQTRDLIPNNIYIYDLKEDTNYLLGPAPRDAKYIKTLLSDPKSILNQDQVASSSADKPETVYNSLQQDQSELDTLYLFKAHYSPLFTNNIQWFPSSNHLITIDSGKVVIKEYDNLNSTTIYSGPFDQSFVYPSPNGDRLLILTNLNQDDNPQNLYTLELR